MNARDRPKADGSAMRARGPEANLGQKCKTNCQTNAQTNTNCNNNQTKHLRPHVSLCDDSRHLPTKQLGSGGA